jgi:hypothetical protein
VAVKVVIQEADYCPKLAKQKHETLSEKQTKSKKTGSMAHVVECLPTVCEALSSILVVQESE